MDLRRLLEGRSARALDEDADGSVLVATDLSGTFQLYETGAELRRLTDLPEPVSGRYLPHTRHLVVQMDAGGNERHQLYLAPRDGAPTGPGELEPITGAAEFVHQLIGVSPDGSQVAYTSNERNGVDFDVVVQDLVRGDTTVLYDGGGWAQPATGWSPSGRYLSFLLPGTYPLDSDLVLVDLEGGELLRPLAHEGAPARVGGPAWLGPHRFAAADDRGRDFAAIVAVDLEAGTTTPLLEEEHDLTCVTSQDGGTLLVVANENGASRGKLFDVVAARPPSLKPAGELALPGRGVIAGSLLTPPPLLAPDGSHVTYTFTSPVLPGDVFRAEKSASQPQRLTASPGPDPLELVEPTFGAAASFDDESVPLYCYEPTASREGPLPVVVVVHGGPESQSMLNFNPVVQGLVELGFAVVVPNVRGSTGYGRRYASLDDTTKRLDSVRDLAAVHDWLATAGFDTSRAALWGGSYGGYMVLAGLAFQPDRWAAGVDIVGISDLVTFLENTSAYRRAHRQLEYGSLETDREFLAEASPLRRADQIRAPLFVIHGENDPRVPVSEARQLVESLARRGVDHELLVFPDEGHGLQKLENRLEALPRAVDFLSRHLMT